MSTQLQPIEQIENARLIAEGKDYLAIARSLREPLAAGEAAVNQARTVPAATIARLRSEGLFRLTRPKEFAGEDGDFQTFLKVTEELAHGCSSTAWVYCVLSIHSLFLSCWPESVQRAVWGDNPDILISSSLSPKPIAKVNGGWKVSGQWSFSSGCDHAEYAIIGGLHEGRPLQALLPLTEAEIIDDWYVLGMRGTGSKTLNFEDVFAPEEWVIPMEEMFGPVRRFDPAYVGSLWYNAEPLLFSTMIFFAVSIGLMARAIDIAAGDVRGKIGWGVKLDEYPVNHMILGEACGVLENCRLVLYELARKHDARVRGGTPLGPNDMIANLSNIATATRNLRTAAMNLADVNIYWLYDRHPLQQVLRDLLTTTAHRSVNWQGSVAPAGELAIREGVL